MAPKRSKRTSGPTPTVEINAENLAQIIADQIAAALLNAGIQPNVSSSGGAGGEEEPIIVAPIEMVNSRAFKSFTSCKPMEFKGTEGAVGALRWIEKLESIMEVCGTPAECKVKYAAFTFQGKALTWWNTQIRIRGRDVMNSLSWKEFKEVLIGEFCPENEMERIQAEFWNLRMIGSDIQSYTNRFHELSQLVPHMVTPERSRISRYIKGLAPEIKGNVRSATPTTLEKAIVLAGSLTDDLIEDGAWQRVGFSSSAGFKRGREDDRHDAPKRQNFGNRGEQLIQSYASTVQEKKGYTGNLPRCTKCNYHHIGECATCDRCKKLGHVAKYCRTSQVKTGTCFECGSSEHYRNQCPKINDGRRNTVPPARGRVYVMGTQETQQNPDSDTGTSVC